MTIRVRPRGLPLTRYILLHTQQGLKSVTNYLQSTQIRTRKWFTDIEEADIEAMMLLDGIEQMLAGANSITQVI
jgi:hypothetical protein